MRRQKHWRRWASKRDALLLYPCKDRLDLDIGGSVGSGGDYLNKFKAAFNRKSDYQFSIAKMVFDQEQYDALVADRAARDSGEREIVGDWRGIGVKEYSEYSDQKNGNNKAFGSASTEGKNHEASFFWTCVNLVCGVYKKMVYVKKY